MKGLSIEEKAKRYESSLERCRKLYNEAKANGYTSDTEDYETIFPELKESEDEKIRKAIHNYLDWLDGRKDYAPRGEYTIRDMIAFLERQSERKPIVPKFRIGDIITPKDKNEHYTITDIVDEWYEFREKHINGGIPIRYQDEWELVGHKPADKVEPKFKVGDWIVNNQTSIIYLVKSIRGDEYCLWPLDAEIEGFLRIVNVDSEYHLWTIQDAKDGDVLATEDWVFIFEKMNYNGKPICYCHYDIELGFRIDTNSYIAPGSEIYPATKEQRDTLMKAMADAGYIFDFDKKELKKIEQKPDDTYCQKHCKGYQETGRCFADGDCQAKRDNDKKLQQETKEIMSDNFAWCEEDEYYYGIIQYILNNECVGKTDKDNAINWFKSLRPHIQLSKEDIEYYNTIITILEHTKDINGLSDNQINFLRSFIYKSHRKLSEEQIEQPNMKY